MTRRQTETISFGKKYQEEHAFLLEQSKGNKSYYICELLKKERLKKEGDSNE